MKFFLALMLVPLLFGCNDSTETSEPPISGSDISLTDLISSVDSGNVVGYVKSLTDFESRFFSLQGAEESRNWLKSKLESFGYKVTFQPFSKNTSNGVNVIAERNGFSSSMNHIVMGAHYDSRAEHNNAKDTLAPGADDNASGTAILLEAARLLADKKMSRPVRFVFFDMEEVGLVGSNYYSTEANDKKHKIDFMFNLDMVGGFEGMTHSKIVCEQDTKAESIRLNEELQAAISSYTTLTPTVGGVYGTDYMGFKNNGYTVLGLFEYEGDKYVDSRGQKGNPHYHKSTDNFENLNKAYFYQVAKGAIAFLGKKSGLSD